mmetsp:Transcript_38484/g.63605  ORF Transcript_38484/g.63605 Transcript_38484/m.63605 type:complete len:91 (+) Transcript_38484:172-444(+)
MSPTAREREPGGPCCTTRGGAGEECTEIFDLTKILNERALAHAGGLHGEHMGMGREDTKYFKFSTNTDLSEFRQNKQENSDHQLGTASVW